MGFGSDFYAFDDLDPLLTFLEGDDGEAKAMALGVARRFITPRAGLFYDGSYGLDIRKFISDVINPSSAQAMIEAEAKKDERVDDCVCTIDAVTLSGADTKWLVTIACTATNGASFSFTLEVSAVTVSLLTVGQ